MSLIGHENYEWCFYLTDFYPDQAFIPISCFHVNTATVKLLCSCVVLLHSTTARMTENRSSQMELIMLMPK